MASHCSWDKDQIFNKERHGFPTVRVEGGGGVHPCRPLEVQRARHSTAFPGSFCSVLIFRCQLTRSVHFHGCLLGSASHPPYLACSVACFFSVLHSLPCRHLSHLVMRPPSVPLQVSFSSPAPPPPQLLKSESYLLFTAFP